MIRINLLPWREALRRERLRQLIGAVVLALLVTGGFMYGWRVLVNGQIDDQRARNAFLSAEIAKVDEKLKEIADLDRTKARILARMEVIQELQARRPEAVHLMDELVTAMPDGVFLRQIKQAGRVVELFGMAESNARVSALMRLSEASPWLANPQLQIVENKSQDKAAGSSEFRLVINQARSDAASGE